MVVRTNLFNTHVIARSGSARATVREFDDKHLVQEIIKADVTHSETPSNFERWQMVGITAVPLKQADDQQQGQQQQSGGGSSGGGDEQSDSSDSKWNHNQPKGKAAEALMMYIGGSRSHPVAMVDDRRVRPYGMKEGESAMYAASGTGQMLFHSDKGSHVVVTNNPPEQSKDSNEVPRYTSVRHVQKKKQPREIKEGQDIPDPKHEGEKVNLEDRTTKDQRQTRDGDDAVVGLYEKNDKRWTHRILESSSDPAAAAPNILSDLGGMIDQAQALTTAGAGLPGIQGIGTQIAGMGSQITGAGGSSSIASAITSLGTSMSSGLMTGMAGLMSSLTSQMSSLTSMLNPGGAMSKVLHSDIIDKAKGIINSAFNGKHTISLLTDGVSLKSSAKVESTAPQIPHNGQVYNSNDTFTTGSDFAAAFPLISDARLKSKIEDHPSVLDKIMSLKLKAFDVQGIDWLTDTRQPPRRSIGLLAQDVREVFPEIVHDNGYLAIEESKIGVLLLAAFQEFVAEVRGELDDLKKKKKKS